MQRSIRRLNSGAPRLRPSGSASRLSYRATGALIVAVAVAIVVVAYTGFNPFDDSTTVRAEFRDASGIGVVGQDVRIAGVPVGRITDVDRSGDDAIVTMKLDSDVGTIR